MSENIKDAAVSSPAVRTLHMAQLAINNRAAVRDLPDGERSMPRAVAMFNAWRTGFGQLTEVDGWVFMVLLKLARSNAGAFHQDDYVDAAGYIGLAEEAAERQEKRMEGAQKPNCGVTLGMTAEEYARRTQCLVKELG